MEQMRFADRTDLDSTSSPYGEALRVARRRSDFVDLTLSNPTRAGFDYSAIDLTPLSAPASLEYNADPMGSRKARESVAAMYPGIDPKHVLLTASTSETYAFLFRLFCEPGSQVLVPSPSYPLFDLLARLHDVELVTYPLVYHDGWQIDPASLSAAVTENTRAIVAIHPNNPTGHYCSVADRAALTGVAEKHSLPLIVDEVFLDYAVEGGGTTFGSLDGRALTFILGGLSKTLALPQMKLAWTVVSGSSERVADALSRLEIIADTFLSVATPVQVALPMWLAARSTIQEQIRTRVRSNLHTLDATIAKTCVSRLKVEGGWSAVLRIPALEFDERFAVRLLEQKGTAVHPGSFYGFPQTGWLVISLLADCAIFAEGIARLLDMFPA